MEYIIVIHLSNNPAKVVSFNGKLIEIFPSENLGGFVEGTMDFMPESIAMRIKLGYKDTKTKLISLGDACCNLNGKEINYDKKI